MRRLLMISPHFPPDSSAGTHRVRLLAPHLSGYGWEPTVLTVAEQDYEGRLDPDLASLVPASLRVVRARALSAHLTRAVGLGDLGLRALPGLRRAAWDLLERDRFDAVFITIYPTYPAVLGPMIKRRFGMPFVLDYQDPWVGAWGRDVGGGANGAVDFKSRSTRAIGDGSSRAFFERRRRDGGLLADVRGRVAAHRRRSERSRGDSHWLGRRRWRSSGPARQRAVSHPRGRAREHLLHRHVVTAWGRHTARRAARRAACDRTAPATARSSAVLFLWHQQQTASTEYRVQTTTANTSSRTSCTNIPRARLSTPLPRFGGWHCC